MDLAASLLDASHAEHQPLLTRIDKARARTRCAATPVAVGEVGGGGAAGGRGHDRSRSRFFSVRSSATRRSSRKQRSAKHAVEQRGIAEEQKTEADAAASAGRRAKRTSPSKQTTEPAEAARPKIAVTRAAAGRRARRRSPSSRSSKAEASQAGRGVRGLHRPDRPGECEDQRQRLRLRAAAARCEQAGAAELGMGPARCICASWALATYKAAGPVDAVAYSPDGKSFATGDLDGKVTVRDAQTGDVRFQVPHGQYVLSVAYSPDGKQIAAGSSDKTIQILDAATGNVRSARLTGHTDGVLSRAILARWPATAQRLVRQHGPAVGPRHAAQTLQEFKGHSWWVWAAEFSPDGNRIVTAGQDGKAIVWEKRERWSRRSSSGDQNPQPAAAPPTAQPLRTAHRVHRPQRRRLRAPLLAQWQARRHRRLRQARDDLEPGRSAAGRHRASDSTTSPTRNSNYMRLAGHDGPVRSVSFSPNGQLVLSGSEDNTVRIWDVAGGEAVKALRGHGRACGRARSRPMANGCFPAARTSACGCGTCKAIRKSRVLHATVFAGHEDAVLSARYSRDGKKIVTASRDRTASLWDAASGKPLERFEEGHEFLVSGAVFLPDGRRLATGAGDNSVRIWDLDCRHATGRARRRPAASARSPCRPMAIGSRPAAPAPISSCGTPTPAKPLATLSGHDAEVSALMFSPAGRAAGQRRQSRPRAALAAKTAGPAVGRSTASSSATAARSPPCDSRPMASGSSRPAATTPAANGTSPPAKSNGNSC